MCYNRPIYFVMKLYFQKCVKLINFNSIRVLDYKITLNARP